MILFHQYPGEIMLYETDLSLAENYSERIVTMIVIEAQIYSNELKNLLFNLLSIDLSNLTKFCVMFTKMFLQVSFFYDITRMVRQIVEF